jgi:WD40 repeat protein
MAVAISPDGKYFASGSSDLTIRLWDAKTYEPIKVMHGHAYPITDVQFTPDSKYLVSCGSDKTVRLWNVETGKTVRIMREHKEDVMDIDISPNGKLCLSASLDKTIVLWDLTSGKEIYKFTDHTAPVNCVSWAPDGEHFMSAGDENELFKYKIDKRVFVDAYFSEEYNNEIASDSLFVPQKENETRADFKIREEEQEKKRQEIVDTYYNEFLSLIQKSEFEPRSDGNVKVIIE